MSIVDTLGDILADGGRLADEQSLADRLAVCGSCQFGVVKALGLTCSRCGCVMAIKARFMASACPEGLWAVPEGRH